MVKGIDTTERASAAILSRDRVMTRSQGVKGRFPLLRDGGAKKEVHYLVGIRGLEIELNLN